MCILAGCDFLKAPPNIGMKKAHMYMRKCRNFNKVHCLSTALWNNGNSLHRIHLEAIRMHTESFEVGVEEGDKPGNFMRLAARY